MKILSLKKQMSFPKKSSFKPAKYGARINSNTSLNRKSKFSELPNEIVTKGGDKIVQINFDDIVPILSELSANYQLPIKSLTGDLFDKFRRVVTTVNLLYDTDYFKSFHDLIKSHTSHIKNVEPGTIGAYLVGCLLNCPVPDDIPKSCTPICAGSIPLPKDTENWQFCDHTVIWGYYDGSKYNLTVLNRVPNTDKVLIFLNHTNINNFQGFTDDDKLFLQNYGSEFKLIGYTNEGCSYVTLYPSYLPLTELKSRVAITPSGINSTQPSPSPSPPNSPSNITPPQSTLVTNYPPNNTPPSNNSSNLTLIILLVLIILIIIFVAWRMSYR